MSLWNQATNIVKKKRVIFLRVRTRWCRWAVMGTKNTQGGFKLLLIVKSMNHCIPTTDKLNRSHNLSLAAMHLSPWLEPLMFSYSKSNVTLWSSPCNNAADWLLSSPFLLQSFNHISQFSAWRILILPDGTLNLHLNIGWLRASNYCKKAFHSC